MSQDTTKDKTGEILPQMRSHVLVALGSNEQSEVGSPTEALHKAVTKLREHAVIRSKSAVYQTPAFPAGSGPDFVNAVIAIEANWTAREAITHLHSVEASMGRRRQARWEQRLIDLDLLAIGDLVRPDMATLRTWMDMPLSQQQERAPGQLILPHPRMHERAFVLVPLADVAPNWVHPVTRRTVTEMVAQLPEETRAEVVKIENGWS